MQSQMALSAENAKLMPRSPDHAWLLEALADDGLAAALDDAWAEASVELGADEPIAARLASLPPG